MHTRISCGVVAVPCRGVEAVETGAARGGEARQRPPPRVQHPVGIRQERTRSPEDGGRDRNAGARDDGIRAGGAGLFHEVPVPRPHVLAGLLGKGLEVADTEGPLAARVAAG
jgi:hypothetical protein